MTEMKHYQNDGIKIMYKIIQGKAHPRFRKSKSGMHQLGIALRTEDAPIGYLPFYDQGDFDLSGDVSLKEKVLGNLPINLSATASPYTLLLKAAAEDFQFMGVGSPDLTNIQTQVRNDLTGHAMASAGGVFVDGVMMAIGGPTIKTIVNQFVKSSVKRFLISKAISSGVKTAIKKQANLDVDALLKSAP